MPQEMTPARWEQIKQIFDQAIALTASQRAAFLNTACAGNAELRAEIETLLAADAQDQSFIEEPAINAVAGAFAEPDEPAAEQRIGPYELICEIGRGGMGTVYLAKRADGQYHQRVALKLIKRGMDSEEIVRRFRHERQILAGLNHPHIARLLDGGTTEDGRPYFVMEYIEGQPITAWCDQQRLNTVERLKLFRTVCAAVHHAHQNLVVHRDLKPGNILVTPDGTVKLLDFGIAKLLNPELSNLTFDLTETGARLMTPEYASPEQVRGETITTASDVYALGVVLYELLTGHRPYRLKSRSLQEVARVICEEEPERPSTAISRIEKFETSEGVVTITPESVSRTREGQPDKLRRRLKGDLDNIALMALRKEAHRRYSSAEQLANDIRRSLEGLPVMARTDTFAYRGAKFVRRHRVGVTAVMLILLTLIAGIVTTLRQARIAERRFNEVRHLANNFLFTFDDAIKNLPGTTPARRLIVNTALEYLDRLAREVGRDSALQEELAAAYIKVGDLQGNPYSANIGDLKGAEESYRKSLTIRQALAVRSSGNLQARHNLAISYERLGDALANRSELAEAEKFYRQALEIYEGGLASMNDDKEARSDLARNYDKLGNTRGWVGDTAGALELHRKGLKLREAIAAQNPNDAALNRLLCVSHVSIGDMQARMGDSNGAITSYDQARQIAQRVINADTSNALAQRDLAMSISKLGEMLIATGQVAEGLAYHREAMSLRQRLALSDPTNKQLRRDLAISHSLFGSTLASAKNLTEALENLRQAVAVFEELQKADPDNATASLDLSLAYYQLGQQLVISDPAMGIESLRQSLAIAENLAAKDQQDTESRRSVSETAHQLAETYLRLAAEPKSSRQQKIERWRQAHDYFQHHLQTGMELQQRGALSEAESASLEKVRKQIAQCEIEMTKLGATVK